MKINEIIDPYKLSKRPLPYRDVVYEKHPELAWEKYKDNPKELKKREHLWVTNPEYAYLYARWVLKKPFPLGEKAIASSPQYAYHYVLDVLKKNSKEHTLFLLKHGTELVK